MPNYLVSFPLAGDVKYEEENYNVLQSAAR
jgi:hypothetical protein